MIQDGMMPARLTAEFINDFAMNIGMAPRRFSLWDRLTYLRIRRPAWLRTYPYDDLMTLFDELDSLFREGTVVWGHIIQANANLFQRGDKDHPGEVVFSLSDSREASPENLRQVAWSVGSLRGTTHADRSLTAIGKYLENERIRVFGVPVPRAVSPDVDCHISTTYFVRKHLPRGRLCSPLLPLIVHPEEPHIALPLPAKYWPESFVQWWSRTE